ncbi:MAG TPA: type II secretion system F family protein [Stellaceae bacterium]|nr:type II secretion system F family protein [Stellaceae bacterium]
MTGLSIDPILFFVAAGLGLTLLCLLFAFGDSSNEKQAKRIERLRQRGQGIPAEVLKLRRGGDDKRALDLLVKRLMPRPDLLRQRLRRTGHEISIGTYGIICFVVAVVAGIGVIIGGFQPLLALPIGILVGLWLPHFAIGRLAGRRAARFTALFSDAIGLMVRGIKSGLPITETFQIVANEVPDPVGTEFRQVSDQIRLGHPIEQALLDAAHRVGTPELKFLVVTLSIQRETGGNLAETLENLDTIIRKRRQMKLKIKAMSSEARASAMIIGSLPFIMMGALWLMNRPYVSILFDTHRGNMVLAAAATSLLFGIGVMVKLARFEI